MRVNPYVPGGQREGGRGRADDLAESAALLAAAQGVLPAGLLRQLHGAPAERGEELIRRGQEQGVFRTDLPTTWLVSAVHYILKGPTS